MPRREDDRMHPWALVAIAFGLFLLAFLCYGSYTSATSVLHASSSTPGWIAAFMFIVIGVAWRLLQVRVQKHDAENANRNAQRTDLTNR